LKKKWGMKTAEVKDNPCVGTTRSKKKKPKGHHVCVKMGKKIKKTGECRKVTSRANWVGGGGTEKGTKNQLNPDKKKESMPRKAIGGAQVKEVGIRDIVPLHIKNRHVWRRIQKKG